jgi:hypothetical protein
MKPGQLVIELVSPMLIEHTELANSLNGLGPETIKVLSKETHNLYKVISLLKDHTLINVSNGQQKYDKLSTLIENTINI